MLLSSFLETKMMKEERFFNPPYKILRQIGYLSSDICPLSSTLVTPVTGSLARHIVNYERNSEASYGREKMGSHQDPLL
jgi:hypothetical protein